MWIRTQDKLGLFELKGVKIREHGFENGTKEYIILGNDNLYNLLGTYKSKERAIEVLDKIQSHLENNYLSISDMPQHNNGIIANGIVLFPNNTQKVYQMPEEWLNDRSRAKSNICIFTSWIQ